MVSESLWLKTLTALLCGLVLSISLMLNVHFLLPLPIAVKLFIGLLLAFILWAGVMTYCFSQRNAWKATVSCLKVFVVSAALNAALSLI